MPRGRADLSATEVIRLAQQHLTVPAELALGEMQVYRGERLNRSYTFVFGRLWDEATQTESVRIDFKTVVNSTADSGSLYTDQRYLLYAKSLKNLSRWSINPF